MNQCNQCIALKRITITMRTVSEIFQAITGSVLFDSVLCLDKHCSYIQAQAFVLQSAEAGRCN